MPMYRVYLLDAAGGFRSRDDYDCADDTAANELASTLLTQNSQAGIWIGTRRVGLIAAGHLLYARALQITH